MVSAFRRHKVIFVSESIRRSWLRCVGPGEWGAVVHNFIDYEQVQAAQKQPPANARRSRYNVFIAAKLYQPKGVGALLECLQGRLPSDMQLVIAGEGMQMSELQARYAGDAVTFLGWLDYPELLARCAGADLVVVPSLLEESCATTILEALALGRPTLALARGGTPELQCYARYPGQLLLFDAMQDLADRLITYRECHTRTDWPDFCGDVAAGIPAYSKSIALCRNDFISTQLFHHHLYLEQRQVSAAVDRVGSEPDLSAERIHFRRWRFHRWHAGVDRSNTPQRDPAVRCSRGCQPGHERRIAGGRRRRRGPSALG